MPRKVLWGMIAIFASAMSCIFAYLLIFVWKVGYQYGIAIALFLTVLLVIGTRISMITPRKFVGGLLMTLALSVNYTCGFLLSIILKVELGYFLVIVFMAAFSIGVIFANIKTSILYLCFAMVISMVITTILLSAPYLIHGYMGMIGDILVGVAIDSMGKLLIFIIFFSFIGATVGSLIGDALR